MATCETWVSSFLIIFQLYRVGSAGQEHKHTSRNPPIYHVTQHIFFSCQAQGLPEAKRIERVSWRRLQNSLISSCVKCRQLYEHSNFRSPDPSRFKHSTPHSKAQQLELILHHGPTRAVIYFPSKRLRQEGGTQDVVNSKMLYTAVSSL
jgi:hypothetical protein